MKPRRIGIIGTGKHGSRYANHIVHDLKSYITLSAICRRTSTSGQEQARHWRTRYYADWQDLIAAPEVDAVISVTTPNLNTSIASHCLQHRKPLLIEKPLATSQAEAQEIVASFTEANLPLTVGQTLRYNPIILGLRHNLPKAGSLYSFCATHQLEPSTLPWLNNPEQAGGGVIFHTAVHVFDALRFITNQEVIKVRASAFQVHNPRLEDLFSAQIEMSRGLKGVVLAGKVGAARVGRYEFMGGKGQLQGDQVHGLLELVSGMTITPLPHDLETPAILPLLRDWLAFLSGKQENPIPGRDGLAAIRICDACRQSAATEKWVEL
ncbi:MAG: Gfo/Idh/MocA family oxidoreductase [Desulfobulbaceae bacterium]|nr:Gfo/Idh/MocA family oxidoreductase [Desulfobulbaceae bacterium]